MKHLFSSILWKLQIIPSLVIFFLMVGIATVNIQFLQINDIENNNLTNNLTNDIVIHTFLIVMAMIFVFFINLKVNAKILNPIKQISESLMQPQNAWAYLMRKYSSTLVNMQIQLLERFQ